LIAGTEHQIHCDYRTIFVGRESDNVGRRLTQGPAVKMAGPLSLAAPRFGVAKVL
jgi:hypothetical protein